LKRQARSQREDLKNEICRDCRRGPTSFGAHVPDLPACVAVADTKEQVLALIQEAIEFHIEGLREDGQSIPEPSSSIEYVEVRAA
jgi:predicted RNase H-like HicB family nuclease